MATKPYIEIIEKDKDHIVYCMFQDLGGLNLFDHTKAIERFINNATKTLEMLISQDIREFLRVRGIIIQDGSEKALEKAFSDFALKEHKFINIIDRYYEIGNEQIVGESPNMMTCILENENLISCSMEIRVEEIEDE